MRKFILASIAFASLAMPLAAQAQPGEYRHDRREIREDRRELREDRRDFRRDRREFRDDRRGGYDRGYRGERFRAGSYYHPRGYGYRSWNTGAYLPRAYWGQRYWIGNPVGYRLDYARPGTRWIRVGPDALLIRTYNGSVIRVVRNLFY
ncbi:RcnB family protein [Glacieibacterium sp.]|uniref:RcnB family protein n=1 Tax=Glacieibacterium sp. TaxID=2860237 RepID=UPI003AFFB349